MLVGFNAAGVFQFSQTFGGANLEQSPGLALRDNGEIAMTGAYGSNNVSFGGAPLSNGGSNDLYLAKYTVEFPVPVLFTRFAAKPGNGGVMVSWDVSIDDETLDTFVLYRREHRTDRIIPVANGDATTTRAYSDRTVKPGSSYDYELVIRALDGDTFRSPVATAHIPGLAAALGQNYPNPFNPRTTMEFTLAEAGFVTLEVFDVSGRRVATLVNGIKSAGRHTVEFGASSLSSGVYSYRLTAGHTVETRKMTILK
jgi:hypothetical protein